MHLLWEIDAINNGDFFPPLLKNGGSVAASNLLHRRTVCGVDVFVPA